MSRPEGLANRSQISRRAFLTVASSTAAGLSVHGIAAAQSQGRKIPVTGEDHPSLRPFDELMTSFVEENAVPGASLAVTRLGKLVYARGFGYSDVERKEPVDPAALFRIASLSKPITAVAVLQLVDQGKLSLDDKVVDRMKLTPAITKTSKPDPRWQQITIRHCLQHTGGWDREKSYDPVFKPSDIATALGIRPPVTPVHIVRFMMGQPLDFAPGEQYAYSNLGYLVLGRILEAVARQKYERQVSKGVLSPLGIKRMQLGRALADYRVKGEVKYYDRKSRTGPALFPPRLGQEVPFQYGAMNVDAFEAHGGWIASAVDLVKFASAFDEPAKCSILSEKCISEMWARPAGIAGKEPDGSLKDSYYGCGWSVRPVGNKGKLNAWHTGAMCGTESLLVRRWDGLNWAVLFNTENTPSGGRLAGLIDGRMHQAADQVKDWPVPDLFNKFSV